MELQEIMTQLYEHFEFIVVIACLGVGYLIKTSFDNIPNKYIPLIVAIIGAIVHVCVKGLSIESIVYGMATGLVATGLHQAYTRSLDCSKEENPKLNVK